MTTTITPATDSPLARLLADDAALTARSAAISASISAYDENLLDSARRLAACETTEDFRAWTSPAGNHIARDGDDLAAMHASALGRAQGMLAELARMVERLTDGAR